MTRTLALLLILASICHGNGIAQEQSPVESPIESLRDGFKRFEQGRLTLITDVPIDDELRSWPEILDQAVAIWTRQWQLDPAQSSSWRMTAYLIGDRKRFLESGLETQIPSFEDGYQMRDTIFFIDQPSVYYRRHLFLHEATHWAMYRSFGGAGSPWYMEGMADLYGTHRWKDRKLSLGIVPSSPSEVPQWGRFKRLEDMLSRNEVPTLKQIVNYSNDSGNRMDRYVWSWAACTFFSNHPQYREALATSAQGPLDYSMRLSQKLLDALEPRWPWVVAEWNGFLSDFDFGYVPERSMPLLGEVAWSELDRNESAQRQIDAAKGWQATGIRTRPGETLHITAEGSYQVGIGANGKPWISEPQGITIRYVKHQPLGRLMAVIVPFHVTEETKPWVPIAIGHDGFINSDHEGLLLLKINDSPGDLDENQGNLRAAIRVE